MLDKRTVLLEDINIIYPFYSFFSFSNYCLVHLKYLFTQEGFPQNNPLYIWDRNNTLLSGFVRYYAAKGVNLETVYVHINSFNSMEEAILFSINQQKKDIESLDKHKLMFNLNHFLDLQLEIKDNFFLFNDRMKKYQNIKPYSSLVESDEVRSFSL